MCLLNPVKIPKEDRAKYTEGWKVFDAVETDTGSVRYDGAIHRKGPLYQIGKWTRPSRYPGYHVFTSRESARRWARFLPYKYVVFKVRVDTPYHLGVQSESEFKAFTCRRFKIIPGQRK